MSWEATGWAVKQRCGGALTKYTLLTYAQYADGVGSVYWSQRKIAIEMEMSVDALRGHAEKLEQLELITRFKTKKQHGAHGVDLVVVRFNEEAENYREFLFEHSEQDERGRESNDGSRRVYPTVSFELALAYERPERSSGGYRPERKGKVPAKAVGPIDNEAVPPTGLQRYHRKNLIKESKSSVPSRTDEASGEAEGQPGKIEGSEADEALRRHCHAALRGDAKYQRTFVDYGTHAFNAWVKTFARLGIDGPPYARRFVGNEQRNGAYFPSAWPPDVAEAAA